MKEEKRSILSPEKMKRYLNYCNGKMSSTFCDHCEELVDITIIPYFYDEQENDVYFASLCPLCGGLIITKE